MLLRIPATNRLDRRDLDDFLEAAWRATTGTPIAAALGSDADDVQDAAVYDCWGLGRGDPRYLVLLRRAMFGLRLDALDRAIHILNSCSLNMDNLARPEMDEHERPNTVRAHFSWSVNEAVAMLDRVQDEDGFERGSFS